MCVFETIIPGDPETYTLLTVALNKIKYRKTCDLFTL